MQVSGVDGVRMLEFYICREHGSSAQKNRLGNLWLVPLTDQACLSYARSGVDVSLAREDGVSVHFHEAR